jgi:predicted Zn-dependent peptidase
MKKNHPLLKAGTICIGLLVCTSWTSFAQGNKPVQPGMQNIKQVSPNVIKAVSADMPTRTSIMNEANNAKVKTFSPTTFKDDPMNTQLYRLRNGLSVWITVNKNEPRLQTMIAVKAGSKNDPSTHTGLAHYLEHMLFKGTDQFGTKDYASEKVLLDKIEALYEIYGAEKDEVKRKAIYHEIDSVSGEAAKFAIANEYDKMVSNLGAKGTNAFTSTDMTVYINDIPANQLEKWLTLEAERFRSPVLRIFHTELEAVYEEKNRTLDNDGRKVEEALMASLFKNHSYGTQTTIGTIEHLKSPSIVEIKKYFNANYVPNNMAIILSGDIDPDVAIAKINELFGNMQPKEVAPYIFKPEVAKTAPEEKTIYGPDKEEVTLGYRLPGCQSSEYVLQQMVDYLVSNGTAGLLNLNLLKTQKVLDASAGLDENSDYNSFLLSANPREGQTLEECKNLLLEQLELLKKGAFDESLLPAIIANMKVEELKRLESNSGRAFTLENLFVHNVSYTSYVNRFAEMKKITKQDIVNFANNYFTNDYAVVYKKTGEDKTTIKVTKPAITPVSIDRTAQSAFLKKINSMPVAAIKR